MHINISFFSLSFSFENILFNYSAERNKYSLWVLLYKSEYSQIVEIKYTVGKRKRVEQHGTQWDESRMKKQKSSEDNENTVLSIVD